MTTNNTSRLASGTDPAETAAGLSPAMRGVLLTATVGNDWTLVGNARTIQALAKRGICTAPVPGQALARLTSFGRQVHDLVWNRAGKHDDQATTIARNLTAPQRNAIASRLNAAGEVSTHPATARVLEFLGLAERVESNWIKLTDLGRAVRRAVQGVQPAPMRQQPQQQHQAADTTTATEQCTLTAGCYKLADHLGGCSDDPFEGIPDDSGHEFLASLDTAVQAKTTPHPNADDPTKPLAHFQTAADGTVSALYPEFADIAERVNADRDQGDGPTFPTDEPEPPISLAQFQKRAAAGEYATPERRAQLTEQAAAKQAKEAPRVNPQQSSYGLSILAALGQRGRHVYGGTVSDRTRQTRRRRNRAAARTRRINRGR